MNTAKWRKHGTGNSYPRGTAQANRRRQIGVGVPHAGQIAARPVGASSRPCRQGGGVMDAAILAVLGAFVTGVGLVAIEARERRRPGQYLTREIRFGRDVAPEAVLAIL